MLSDRFFREIVRSFVDSLMFCRMEGLDLAKKHSAVFIAPHPDDEVLGGGGTIIRKVRQGCDVSVVFMTDGRHSHRGLIDEHELGAIRKEEARNVGCSMGLGPGDMYFLEIENDKLQREQSHASEMLEEIFADRPPDEVFVPCCRESHSDHLWAGRIARSVIERMGLQTDLYGYPVWFWAHWPRIGFPGKGRRDFVRFVIDGLASEYLLQRDFGVYVDVSGVAELKRSVLEMYRSQMSRLVDDRRWYTLTDVSGGEFLECFLGSREIFQRY